MTNSTIPVPETRTRPNDSTVSDWGSGADGFQIVTATHKSSYAAALRE